MGELAVQGFGAEVLAQAHDTRMPLIHPSEQCRTGWNTRGNCGIGTGETRPFRCELVEIGRLQDRV